jgi:hypothetical protein
MLQIWDPRLYFPSEGRRAEDFSALKKIQRLRPGLNPRTWVPEARTLTPRPPKPLNEHMVSDLTPTEKEDLVQVSSDTNLKSKFQDIFVDSFWITPKNKCPEIVNKYVDIKNFLLFQQMHSIM